jgi:hypothetical protein
LEARRVPNLPSEDYVGGFGCSNSMGTSQFTGLITQRKNCGYEASSPSRFTVPADLGQEFNVIICISIFFVEVEVIQLVIVSNDTWTLSAR